jgi:Peptidase M10 serralysin C terminal
LSDNIKLDISMELALLNGALKENEDLYTEVKTHYDRVKQGGSGTLQFVEKQTANLISLKSNKLSIIQQMITAKKVDAETKLKIITANKGGDGNDKLIGDMANAMYDLILTKKKDKSFDDIMGAQKKIDVEVNSDDDVDVDALLEARLEELEPKEEEKKEETIVPQYTYVVDMDKNIYCVDAEYNFVEDAVIPELDITITEIDGEYVAVDQNGNRYDLVEFDEE